MSMLSPESFKRNHENLSIKELIRVRRDIIYRLNEYEDVYIIGQEQERDVLEPSPSTRYAMNNEYLKVITTLIEEKREQEYLDSLNIR